MSETLRDYLGWTIVFATAILLVQVQGLAVELAYVDEGTFLLMAQDVLRGHLPYTFQFDNKPPGLALSLAGTMHFFGQTLLVARATGWAWLLACSVTTFAAARYLAGTLAAGLAVTLMIACTAMPYGFHANAEIPALAFLMLALWAALRHRGTQWGAAVCGLAISLAILLRTNLAYVGVGFGLAYLAGAIWPRLGFPRPAILLYAISGVAPIAILAAVYAAHGALSDLYLSAIVVPLSFTARGLPWHIALVGNLANLLQSAFVSPVAFTILVTLALAGYVRHMRGLFRTKSLDGIIDWAILGLAAGCLGLSMLRGGAAYPHYLPQLFPFFALGVALMLKPGLPPFDQRVMFGAVIIAIGAGLVVNAPLSIAAAIAASNSTLPRPLQDAAIAIQADMKPGDKVWALDKQLVSFYLDAPPITRFATHPDSVGRAAIMDPLIEAGYAPPDLLGAILEQKPRYIVSGPNGRVDYFSPADTTRLTDALAANYRLWLRSDEVSVYRRNE